MKNLFLFKSWNMKVTYIMFCPILLFISLNAAAQSPSYSKADSPLKSISVPKIDPRQYVVIYEWKEANENRWVKGLDTDKNELRQLKVWKQRCKAITDSINELESELSQLNRRIELLDSALMEKYTAGKQVKKDTIDAQIGNASEVNNTERELKLLRQQAKKKKKMLSKWKNDKKSIESLLKFKGRYKPYDFFNPFDRELPDIETYKDYYNHYFWKNGGTPNWEPIWWLNQYPWPNMDYRVLDLEDPDQAQLNYALIPFQKYKVVDPKSTLRITFDKDGLAYNENFKGSISLEAFLYDGRESNADPREIEVNPYSVIGEERKTIGLDNRPADEVADYLLRFVKQIQKQFEKLQDFRYKHPDAFYYQDYVDEYQSTQNDVKLLIEYMKDTNISDNTKILYALSKMDNLCFEKYDKSIYSTSSICSDLWNMPKLEYNEKEMVKYLISRLEKFLKEIEAYLRPSNDDEIEKKKLSNDILNFLEDLKLFKNIITYFTTYEGVTQEAYLKLIGKEILTFNHYKDMFINHFDKLEEVSNKSAFKYPREFREQISKSIEKIEESILELGDISGNLFSDFLNDLGYYYSVISYSFFYENIDSVQESKEFLELWDNPKDLEKVKSFLAQKAGETLYEELVYATIDLDLADANPGDQLLIRLIWNIDPESDTVVTGGSIKDGAALYVAKFDLKETGWKMKISENALLIKRFDEDLLRTDYPLDPSNFALSGGASIMWGYNNDYRVKRRIKLDDEGFPRFDKRGRLKSNRFCVGVQKFWKFFEPSFGVNVSYLNYRTDEALEIGVGPAMGLFNNVFFITYGWNLMELQEQSSYLGIGISFLNLGARLSN